MCLWYDGDAEEAARFYATTFPDSAVGEVFRAPADYPSGKQGDVLTVWFTVMGVSCLGLNGGRESVCGWREDTWGISWQITPVALTQAISDANPVGGRRAFEAMMGMTKIDIAALEAAVRG